ncbi:MAG: tetratricopeptide repeat protein [Armatimonadota bacterium]|nr:tetratricopeptide repeat protein [Armatimonadota bacterium]
MKIAMLALAAILTGSAVPASGQAVRFAVAPCTITADPRTTEWLGAGVVFDIEKRLERWSGFRSINRLKVRGALKAAAGSDEQAVARALFERLELDSVVTLTGSCLNGELELRARIWTGASASATELRVKGTLGELFVLHDRLIDELGSGLRSTYPRLQAPDKPNRLHIAPAKSVEAYELLIRGMVALQHGSPKSGRPILEKARELEPDLWWSHYFLGAVEFHEGNFEKAIERCRAAIALDPNLYAGVYANLAYCYQGMADEERFQWAKDEFERRTGKDLPQRSLPSPGLGRAASK